MHSWRLQSDQLALLSSCFAAWRLWRADARTSAAHEQLRESRRVSGQQARQRLRQGLESALRGTQLEARQSMESSRAR